MTSPAPAKSVKIQLAGKERVIVYNNRAEFRMGSLERPFVVLDLNSRRRSWAALVAWIWACLSDRDAADFASPEQLSEHMRDTKVTQACMDAFIESWKAAQEPEEGTKNG